MLFNMLFNMLFKVLHPIFKSHDSRGEVLQMIGQIFIY